MNRKTILYIITAAFGFYLINRLFAQARLLHTGGRTLDYIADHITDGIWNSPGHLSFRRPDILAALTGPAAAALFFLYHSFAPPTRKGEEHGSARWGGKKDFAPFRAKTKNGRTAGILYTKKHALSLETHKTRRNLNSLIIGASGSGKTRFFLLPNIRNTATSFIITDPKGEIYKNTAAYLKENGYKTRCLNLVDLNQSSFFNPYTYIKEDTGEIDINILVKNIITNTSGTPPRAGDSFWEKAETALLTALITYTYAISTRTGSLIDALDLLAQMSAAEAGETREANRVDLLFEAVAQVVEEAEQNIFLYDPGARQTLALLKYALSQYNTYTQGAGETKKSVIISLGVRLAPMHMASMRRLLAKDTLALDKIGTEKTALYLIIPDTHATFNFLAAVCYQQLFETNIYIADHTPGGRLPLPVIAYMDEFSNIGQIPGFTAKLATIRSRNMAAAIIVQNLSQLRNLYKDEWETIIANCDSLLFLGGADKATTEYISALLGRQTIAVGSTSVSKGTRGHLSQNTQNIGRALLLPDELARLDTRQCVYILRGTYPFTAGKMET